MPPISRREQVELDELLSDIYRGIETLPDHGSSSRSFVITRREADNKSPIIGHAYVREFEVSESSPLVQQHKQAIAATRTGASAQPQRSTLKRQQTGGGTPDLRNDQQQTRSLASFLNTNPAHGPPSSTPENKRRVRIVDHKSNQSEDDDDYPATDYYESQARHSGDKRERVKQVNTNKLIYHDEEQASDEENTRPLGADDDDIDGVTRVEYYHTTWLDRQLGRASKRRSSKELNERQVKEKAMIEELKRSLKNGAITLRQSLKKTGKKNGSKHDKASEIFDDQLLDRNNNNFRDYDLSNRRHEREQSKVVRTGIATLPRHHSKHKHSAVNNSNSFWPDTTPKNNFYSSQRVEEPQKFANNDNIFDSSYQTKQTSGLYPASKAPDYSPRGSDQVATQQSAQMHDSNYHDNINQAAYSSRTLPHKRVEQPHQLLQSHYRGNLASTGSSKTLNRFSSPKPTATATPISYYNQQQTNTDDKMRNPAYSGANRATHCASPSQQHSGMKSPLQQQNTFGASISSVPSASEVVKSALSRSNSQLNINQLNKTINLLPQTPPATSPMTPTHQLKPTSPSLSPSPQPSHQHKYMSKTLGHQQQQQYLPGQTVLHGTRTVGQPPQVQQTPGAKPATSTQQQQPQLQSAFSNPHASLMQHRMEQQSRQPNRNTASIREFNELDSLLRSLSPGASRSASVSTHITPGYSNKPGQASLGGYMPANYQQQQQQQTRPTASDIYAKVQKPPTSNLSSSHQSHQSQQTASTAGQPFTIDVTDKKLDENCIQRQRQDISEFEPSVDLLPSMEDYQNIAKLNPVKNHYWYKPNMSRDRAISLLKDKPQGTFIVRDSTSFKGAYGLAVRVTKLPKNILANLRNSNGDTSAEYIRHFLIEPTGAGVRLKGYANEPVFDSLPDLIYQHSLTELALPCRLVIPRADIEDPRFNQLQKQFFDDFIASKEQAKHQPYERTSPDGGYRRYPGDVMVHNEHRIIFE